MIRALQFLFFLLASTVEVEVHAAIVTLPNQAEVAQEPAGCLTAQSVCAIKTQDGRKFETQIGSTNVLLGPDTIIVRLNADSLLLVQGEVWLRAEKNFTARTEYGEIDLEAEGEVFLIRSEQRALVRGMRGEAKVHARAGDDVLPLPAGFEIALAGVSKAGHGKTSLPSVLNFRDHMRRWARLYKGPKKEFKNELQRFDPILREAARVSSRFHADMAQRHLASEKMTLTESEERRRAYQQESARLREIFRERANR